MITALLIFFPLIAALIMLGIKHKKAEITAFYLALVELGIFGYAATMFKGDPSQLALDIPWLHLGRILRSIWTAFRSFWSCSRWF
jgi:NADH-quinone oxidoreductase subunit M